MSQKQEIERLVSKLHDEDIHTRASAAWSLGWMMVEEAEGAVPALILALQDPEPRVRAAVADVLGKIGIDSEDVVSVLIQALQDPDLWVRGIAKDVLKRIKIPAASEAINNFQQQNSGYFE